MNIFKEIINAWRGNALNIINQNEFNRMMKEAKKMHNIASSFIFKKKKSKALEKKLYEEDIFINKAERKIRKRLVEHLAVQKNVDIGMTLVMMSITKDAERIGDYCKNTLQTFQLLKKQFNKNHSFYAPIHEISNKIDPLFDRATKALREYDNIAARNVIDEGYLVEKQCEDIISEISNSKLSANEAVVLSLITRFFKRIAAHLCNIASSVIYPVHKIDFFSKK